MRYDIVPIPILVWAFLSNNAIQGPLNCKFKIYLAVLQTGVQGEIFSECMGLKLYCANFALVAMKACECMTPHCGVRGSTHLLYGEWRCKWQMVYKKQHGCMIHVPMAMCCTVRTVKVCTVQHIGIYTYVL